MRGEVGKYHSHGHESEGGMILVPSFGVYGRAMKAVSGRRVKEVGDEE
jgi:hypothetical protein